MRPPKPFELVVSTRNPGTSVGTALTLSTAADKGVPEVEETGATFADNALLKAAAAFAATGLPALADDSGLTVEHLGGAPGVLSARFAGPQATSQQNNALLLERLAGVPEAARGAAFVCSLVLVVPASLAVEVRPGAASKTLEVGSLAAGAWAVGFEGRVEGRILERASGRGGFGYDPLFFHSPSGCTFAELDHARKNLISHRGKALAGLRDVLGEMVRRRATSG